MWDTFVQENAMATVEDRIFISAPVEKVFRSVTSPENWTRYVPSLTHVGNLSTPQIEPGTTFEWEYRVLGEKLRGTGHVNQVVPNAKFSMSMNGSVSISEAYTFTPVSGGTELSVRIGYALPGALLSAVASGPLGEKVSRMEGRHVLERIKILCEEA
jgi:uncharacterized membrane protein